MKSTGIVRKVDDLGRIVIPIELRRNLEIEEKDPLEIHIDGDQIILRKHSTSCTFCSSTITGQEFKGKIICADCLKALNGVS